VVDYGLRGEFWARGVCIMRTVSVSRLVNYGYSGGVNMGYGFGDQVARE